MKKMIILFGIMSVLAAASEKEVALEKSVVISTTGFTESLLKENKNVTIISKEDLSRKDYHNVEEVLRDAPNVMVQQTYFGPVIDLRGNGERALSRVKVLVDGVAINPIDDAMGTLPINTIPVSSIEKIEVIPGGGAVLNGSGTAGGVVNIITKSTERKNYLSVDYGNFSYATNKTSIGAGYNITKDLYVHAGYSYLNGKGYRDGDDKEHGSVNGGFEYQITPNQKIKFNASSFRGNEDNSNPTKKSELARDRKKAGYPVESHMTRDSYSLDYEIKPTENLTLLTTLYTQHLKRKFTENSIMEEFEMNKEVDLSKKDKSPFKKIHINAKGYNIPATMVGNFDEKTKGAKIRGKYEYAKGELVLGYDYSKTTLKRTSDITASGDFDINMKFFLKKFPMSFPMKIKNIPTISKTNVLNDVYKETNAVYGLNKYNVTDKLSLITGLRYEHSEFGGDRKSNTFVKYSLPKYIPVVGGQKFKHNISESISDKKTSDDFAGEIGLNYLYSDTGNLYFRYERGFISPLPIQITDKTKDGDYKPNNLKSETSDNFEIGVRDFIGDTYVSWSVFTTFTDNEITLIQGNSHNPADKYWAYKNIDKTRRIGTELFAEHYFGKLTLSEGLTYINTKITKGEYKGEKVPLAPEGKITLKANYQFTNKFNAGLTFNYVGKSNVREFDKKDNSIVTKVSGHHFTDLSLQYKVTDYFTVNAGINNLFNTKYNYSETKDYAIPAPERNYYVGANITF